ncbi:MAG TPA: ATP-grasp domain-containing protein [Methylotenera sp.]|nr:ATP-grasp domain-containing protein [Methylotenera sp.]HPV45839.1 ATP-grasp domain-containing protein [Methylotenera sp.]
MIIIAATSARGYAQAAASSGYKVVTLDVFADADTQRIAEQAFKLKMHAQGADAENFKRIFAQINLDDVDGFLYGSLFDAEPELLSWVAERVPLLGNAPDVLEQAKGFDFFKLLDALNITHPEVCLDAPEVAANWLSKKLGGSGGTHIKPANQGEAGGYSQKTYYQKKIAGKPVSMLFLADGKTAKLIGFNLQFVAPFADMPYRFAGAVSGVDLPTRVQQAFEHAAQQLTVTLGLRGINSLDAILDGEALWILELNPRLSATFHLYPNLFAAHMQGCAGNLMGFSLQQAPAKAQLILYADDAVEIPIDFAWPDWVADIPSVVDKASSVKIAHNAPICTVLAEAENADSAYISVLQKAQKLREIIYD